MTWSGEVLALDLASVSGWAQGAPGETPRSGSIRFAPVGSSHEAVFAGAVKWMADWLQVSRPKIVVFEAPLPSSFMRGRTNADTAMLLFGLPAVIGAVAYMRGVYDIRKGRVDDVRQHFIGQRRMPGAQAKRAVMNKCRLLGWNPTDNNAADALALWDYQCSLVAPRYAMRSTPMGGLVLARGSHQ
jgi:crossover junction endodeoxyribonuclease RuvC